MSAHSSPPRVAVVRGLDRRENIRQAQLLLGDAYLEKVKTAKQIFIHPNFVNGQVQLACTHVEAVRAILDVISLHRADPLIIGDAGYHDTKIAWNKLNYASLARSGNAQFIDLNDDATIETFAYDQHCVPQPVPASKTALSSDCIIVVVPAKMHSYYTVTLSLKTHVVGSMVVPGTPFGIHPRWPMVHTGLAPAHRTLCDWFLQYPAHVAVIDGREAMEGNGPASGTKVELNWAVASLEPWAADAVAAWLMGFEVDEIGYLVYLREAGRMVDPEAMEIVGETDWRSLRRALLRPENFPELLGWREGR